MIYYADIRHTIKADNMAEASQKAENLKGDGFIKAVGLSLDDRFRMVGDEDEL